MHQVEVLAATMGMVAAGRVAVVRIDLGEGSSSDSKDERKAEAEQTADIAAAAALAAAAVDNSKLRGNGAASADTLSEECLNPHRRLQQRIQQRLQVCLNMFTPPSPTTHTQSLTHSLSHTHTHAHAHADANTCVCVFVCAYAYVSYSGTNKRSQKSAFERDAARIATTRNVCIYKW